MCVLLERERIEVIKAHEFCSSLKPNAFRTSSRTALSLIILSIDRTECVVMSRLGFNNATKSVVFNGDLRLGELDVIPVTDSKFQFPNNEIRIHHISPLSERCPPLSILQTISSYSVRCKLESSSPNEQSHLINLHASCFYESKVQLCSLFSTRFYVLHFIQCY